MKSIPQLIRSEHSAIKDYGEEKRGTKGTEHKTMSHIQGEEKEHAKMLSRYLKKGKRRSSRR